MITPTIKTTGFGDLDDALRRFASHELREEVVRGALIEATEPLVEKVQAAIGDAGIQRQSGDLIDSIKIADVRKKQLGQGVSNARAKRLQGTDAMIAMGSTSSKARFFEWGTSKMRARPFFRATVEADLADAESGLRARFAAALRKRLLK